MPYVYPPLQKKLLPTVEQAAAVLALADTPLDVARDVRPLMYTLNKMAAVSPRLRGHIRKRRVKVASFAWRVTPHDKADAEAARAAQLRCERVIRTLMQSHHKRALFGVRGMDLNWLPGGLYGTTPYVMRQWKPYELEQNGDTIGEVALLADQDTIARTYLRDIHPQMFIASCDESELSEFRGGILRALLFHEILLDENVQEWGNYNRKLKGIVQATHKQWASTDDKKAAATAVKSLAKNNYALTSDAIQFVYSKIAEASGSMSFKELRDDLAMDRAIAVLGEGNVSSLPDQGGSRAAVEVQERGTDETSFDDLECLKRDINDQLLLYDFQINHAPAAMLGDVPWAWDIVQSEVRDPEKAMAVVTEAKANGIPLLMNEVYEQIGFSMPGDGDPVFTWAQPT